MALVVADRVAETTATTGTGALTLAAALTGFQRFSAVCSTNDILYYVIIAIDTNGNPSGDWEAGLGTYSSANTLTRTTVHFSTNANAAVNLAAGTKQVILTPTATQLKNFTGAGLVDPNADRLLFWDDSAGTVTHLTLGTGLTITGTTIDASAAGAGWNLQWSPLVNEPPSSNYATLDSRNGHPCLDFDTTTQETAVFSGVLPADYSGAGVAIHIYCSLTSAITGTVGWDVAFERMDASTLDIDADSFASATTVTAVTVPGTSGMLLKMSVNVSNGANMDSTAAGEMFRLRIRRDVANDTATGDAELLRVMLVSQ